MSCTPCLVHPSVLSSSIFGGPGLMPGWWCQGRSVAQDRWPPWLGLAPWNRTPRRDCPAQASGDLRELGRLLIHRRRDLAGRVLVAHVGLQRMRTAPWQFENEPPFLADPSGASQQAADFCSSLKVQ